jgi:hypothetical protein
MMAFLELPHSDFAAVLALADGAALVLGRLCLPIHLASSCQDFRQRFLLWASSFSSFHLSATGENRVEVVGRCCRCRCRCRCRLLMSSPGRSVLGNPSTAEPVCFASHLRKYKSASAMFTSQQDATRWGISKWTNSAGAPACARIAKPQVTAGFAASSKGQIEERNLLSAAAICEAS